MPKQGIEVKALKSKLVHEEANWALCIGAGCSNGLFPLWTNLAKSLMKHIGAYPYEEGHADDIIKNFGPDALIQAVYNVSGLDENGFCDLLSEHIYAGLKGKLAPDEWKLIVRGLGAKCPDELQNDWRDFICILQRVAGGNNTSFDLAEIICESIKQDRRPSAILSFNAEPLLYSLLNGYTYTYLNSKLKNVDFVNQSIANRNNNRIPYYFCHGTVPVLDSSNRVKKRFLVADKIVFSENEYLQLSNSSYSWQSSTFINAISSNVVFFVGFSMTDINIRRWLSWLHHCRINEIHRKNAGVKDSTTHFWINKSPHNNQLKRWYEASVAHLGIRIIWIDEWDQIKNVLKIGLGL
ncbi:SIR2 family protein [Alistipes onderdonkii]|uniref:SIR2 family protein n=1 Tax=Alistipes onderdonkii TaxID=328813 RepID=UPI0018763712|nr:SIR2 family protein [Alistipes onderdonkii]MBE5048722.1 SIR2 family protein [Alistipes onderdonkii]